MCTRGRHVARKRARATIRRLSRDWLLKPPPVKKLHRSRVRPGCGGRTGAGRGRDGKGEGEGEKNRTEQRAAKPLPRAVRRSRPKIGRTATAFFSPAADR